jgi:hypothetical protein
MTAMQLSLCRQMTSLIITVTRCGLFQDMAHKVDPLSKEEPNRHYRQSWKPTPNAEGINMSSILKELLQISLKTVHGYTVSSS